MTKKIFMELLNQGDYQTLLSLYDTYKIDTKMDNYFRQVETPAEDDLHYKMLLAQVRNIYRKLEINNLFELPPKAIEVKNIADAVKMKPQAKKTVPEPVVLQKKETPAEETKEPLELKVRPVIDSNPHVNRADLPEDLQAMYDENGKMNQELKSKHALMQAATTDAARKTYVNEIAALEENMRANWKVIDNWYANKDKKEDTLPTAELMKKIKSAENYIRRYDGSKKTKQRETLTMYKEFLKQNKITIPKKKK
jgi:hypothetical protein